METPFTHFVGIDCAAATLIAALSVDGKHVSDLSIDNTASGYKKLFRWLNRHMSEHSDVLYCVENTGVYSEQLCYWLHGHNCNVWLIPPSVTSSAATSRDKTDLVDAKQIAEYAWRHADKHTLWAPNPEVVEQLRILLATREQLTEQLTANRNSLKMYERKVVKSPFAMRVLNESIESAKKTIDELEREMKRLLKSDSDIGPTAMLLMTVPGVAVLLAANLAVATRGFTVTTDPRKLASLIGICPHQYESGTSVFRKPRSAGFGPHRMRKLLYLASMSVKRTHDEFKAYFARKVAEGKNKKLVLNNIANKLLRIICGVLASGRPYSKNYRSLHPQFLTAGV